MRLTRIAMFSYHTCPLASFEGKETGGMNVYVLELSRKLGELGLEVDVFTRSQDVSQPKVVHVTPNVRVIHVLAGPEQPYPKKKLRQFIPEFTKHIVDVIEAQELQYDLYHAHYYLSGLSTLSLNTKRNEHKPIIMTFHTLALMKNLVARTEQEKDGKFRIDAEFLLTKKAQRVIVPSQNDKNYLEYLYRCPPKKIAVVTPGIDTTIFKPVPTEEARKEIGADPNHKIVLFVGRIEPLKGIDILLYATKILLERNPRFKICLWIVGGDVSQGRNLWSNELKKLETLRRVLRIETIVKFVGQEPQQRLPYYYSAADILVMPSHYESFGMAALEAMACGTPVIATNVSGVTDLIDRQEGALISSANNPLLLASQIERLLTDRERHRRLSRRLLAQVHQFTWDRTAKEVRLVYQRVIQ